MAGTRDIQARINSIKDTMKITNAMYLISSNKLRKAKARLEKTEPYFFTLQATVAHIMKHFPEVNNPFFDLRKSIPIEKRKSGFLAVTADKGLAGAYNHNIIKLTTEMLTANKGESRLYVVGQVGMHYFEKKGYEIDETFHYTAQDPSMNRARNISEQLIEKYLSGELDEIYILYTRMVNANEAEPEIIRLLPINPKDYTRHTPEYDIHIKDMPMSPSPDAMVKSIVPICVSGLIYGALVESFCSEQNMRVSAMQNATNSAKSMLHDLSIEYNRMRQAAITQEITEISSGAKAQKKKG